MFLLIVLICFTVFFGALLMYGFYESDGDIIAISTALLILFVGLIGWGMIGNLAPQRHDYADIENPYIHKSISTVYVEYNGYKKQFTDADSYNRINDSTKFVLRSNYNIYGGKISSSIEIKPEAERK